jgi:hypothetical protein
MGEKAVVVVACLLYEIKERELELLVETVSGFIFLLAHS